MMRRLILTLACLIAAASPAFAQRAPVAASTVTVGATPALACTMSTGSGSPSSGSSCDTYLETSNGHFWVKVGSTWTDLTAGGGINAGATNDLACYASSSSVGPCSSAALTFSSHKLTLDTAGIGVVAPSGGTSGAAGNGITITAGGAVTGSGAGTNAGGALTFTAGSAGGQTSGNANGGGITLTSGAGSAHTLGTAANGGTIALQGGNGSNNNSGAAIGGAITLTGGTEFTGGPITITGGGSSATAGSQGGAVTIAGGNTGAPSSGHGGNVTIKGGGGFQSGTVSITTAHTFQNQTLAISIVPDVDGQALNCSPCDNGGAVSIAGGPGQAGNAFSGSSTGGVGGVLTLAGGAGGNVAGGSSPAATGGNGGNLVLKSGAGGTGNPTNGTAGDIVLQGAGTERLRVLGASALVRVVGSTLTATGTGPTLSGCSFSSQAGGLTGGQFLSGTTGTCAVAISGLPAVANGYLCIAMDVTTPVMNTQTATSTTGCTISMTTTSSDKILWWAFGQ